MLFIDCRTRILLEHHLYQQMCVKNVIYEIEPSVLHCLLRGSSLLLYREVWDLHRDCAPKTKLERTQFKVKGRLVTLTALIIDDSPFARRVIRHHLTKFGCKVVGEAESAAQGMRLFEDLRPQLVTLDIMMPGGDGVDALTCFRTMREKSAGVAVIVVSSVPFDRTRETFLKEGALAYMVKPFNQFSFEPVRQKLARFFRPHVA